MKQHFKRSTALVLCLALVMGFFAGLSFPAITASAASNATGATAPWKEGFDSMTVGAWPQPDWSANQAGSWVVTDTQSKNGGQSLMTEVPADKSGASVQNYIHGPTVSVEGIKQIYVKMDALSELQYDLYVRFYDDESKSGWDFSDQYAVGAVTSADTWTTMSKIYDVPANAKTVCLMIYVPTTSLGNGTFQTGNAYFDNLEIRPIAKGMWGHTFHVMDRVVYDIQNAPNVDSLISGLGGSVYSDWSTSGCTTLVTDGDGVQTLRLWNPTLGGGYVPAFYFRAPMVTVDGMSEIAVNMTYKNSEPGPFMQLLGYFFDTEGNQITATAPETPSSATVTSLKQTYAVPAGAAYFQLVLGKTCEGGTVNSDINIYELSIGCTHNWADASCEVAQTCTVCGLTQGAPLGHDWKDATYSAPQTCSRCGATQGSKLKSTCYFEGFDSMTVGAWPQPDWSASQAGSWAVTDAQSKNGGQSLMTEVPAENSGASVQHYIHGPAVSVEGIKQIYVKMDALSELQYDLYVRFYDDESKSGWDCSTQYAVGAVTSADTWTTMSKIYDVPANAKTACLMIYVPTTDLGNGTFQTGKAYFDNLAIRPIAKGMWGHTFHVMGEVVYDIQNAPNVDSLISGLGGSVYSDWDSSGCTTLVTDGDGVQTLRLWNAALGEGYVPAFYFRAPMVATAGLSEIAVNMTYKNSEPGPFMQLIGYFFDTEGNQITATSPEAPSSATVTSLKQTYAIPAGAAYFQLVLGKTCESGTVNSDINIYELTIGCNHTVVGGTCTDDGICEVCGKVFEALGHVPGASATCTTDQVCTACGHVIVAAFGHNDGNKDHNCDNCGSTLTTCTDADQDNACDICGKILAVAQVDGTMYETLADAIAAADGKTVVVLADIELDAPITIPAGVTVTIDLNGKVVSYTYVGTTAVSMFENKGNLTMKDSAGNGKVTFKATTPDNADIPAYANNTFNNVGTLTILSGVYENTSAGYAAYVVDNNSINGNVATLNVNGGKLATDYIAVRMIGGRGVNNVDVTAGEISGYRAIWIQLPGSNNADTPEMNLTMSGGHLISTDTDYNSAIYVRTFGQSYANTNITISGGEITGAVALTGPGSASPAIHENVSITGGKFNGCSVAGVDTVYSYNTTMSGIITGGTFAGTIDESLIADGYALENGAIVEAHVHTQPGATCTDADQDKVCDICGKILAVAQVNGTMYDTLAEALAAAQAGDTITIFEGTYDADVKITKANITVIGQGNVVIKGVPAFTSANFKFENIKFELTSEVYNGLTGSGVFKDCEFTADGNIFRWNYGTSATNITFDGCKLIAGDYAVHYDEANGTTIAFNDCEIVGKVALSAGFQTISAADTSFVAPFVNMYGAAEPINMTGCSFDVIHHIYTGNSNANVFNFTNSTFAKNGVEGTFADVAFSGINKVSASVYVDDTQVAPVIAQIDDKYFVTLKDAIAAADGKTVVVLADIALDAPITIPAGVTVTIDLNGKVVSYTYVGTTAVSMFENKGNLTMKDSAGNGKVTFKATTPDNADIPAYANNTFNNVGTLTILSGVYENTSAGYAAYVVDNNSVNGNVATLNVNGGKLATDYIAVRMYGGRGVNNVDVTAGEISGYRAIWIQLPGSNNADTPEMNLTMSGGHLISTDTVYNSAIYVRTFGQSYANTNITISGGEITGAVALTGPGSASPAIHENVSITGGKFNGCSVAGVDTVYSYNTTMSGIITGGTFAGTIDESLIADGYALENGVIVEAHVHTWTDATCTTPKTCSTCGETEGEALGHTWTDATCTTPKTCSTCGETEGEALGHTWLDATYDAPRTCSACGATMGNPITLDSSLNIQKHTVNMKSSLKLSFRLEQSAIADAADFYVKFVKTEGRKADELRELTITKDEMILGTNGYYYAEFPNVPAAEMGVKIQATLFVVDAEGNIRYSETDSYSVSEYLHLLLDTYAPKAVTNTDKYFRQCRVAVELLNYGAAAQQRFSYKTNELVNESITFTEAAFALPESPNPVNNRNWGDGNDTAEISFKGSTLDLQDRILNQIRFDTANLTTGAKEDLTFVVKNQATGAVLQTITFAECTVYSGTQYYAPITEIKPADMTTIYTIQAFIGDTAVSTLATYSAESYVRLAIDKFSTSAPVALAALRYGIAVAQMG